MTDPGRHLDELLAACAKQSGLRETMIGPAHTALHRALDEDPALATAARNRLATISEAATMRDHVSRWLKATLSKALEAT